MDLFEQVLHALEGTERSPQVWQTADGERTLERRTTGYDRWIESANDGRLEAINALAVILEGVRESFDLDVEREIVEGWAIELRTAAESGEITARNPATLLPLRAVPEGWDWLISIDDLDALVKARGMGWSCTEIVAHLLNESRKTGGRWYDENGRPAAEYWIRGYEPESLSQEMDPALNATPAPTEAAAPAAPGSRQRHQEREILRTLEVLGYDPQRLPRAPAGTPGPKAEVRKKLPEMTRRVFEKAWERLRGFGDIAEAE